MKETIEKITNIIESATEAVEKRGIYQHGYPEARFIPTNWEEECEDCFKENVAECVSEIIADYLDSLFRRENEDDISV